MQRAIVTLAFGTGGCVTNYEKMHLFRKLYVRQFWMHGLRRAVIVSAMNNWMAHNQLI